MFRYSFYGQVRLGQWREFYQLWEKLDQTIRAKELTPAQLWAPTVGTMNGFMVTADYETIEAFHSEGTTFYGDADCMSIWREMGKYVEGTPRDELWESAIQIA